MAQIINEIKSRVLVLASNLPFFSCMKFSKGKENLRFHSSLKVCQVKLIMQPVNNKVSYKIYKRILNFSSYKTEKIGVHCKFWCATSKYSLGILKIGTVSKRKLWLHYTSGCVTLRYSSGILRLLLYKGENSWLHCTFGCATLKYSLGILK